LTAHRIAGRHLPYAALPSEPAQGLHCSFLTMTAIYIIAFTRATGETLAISLPAVRWPKLAQITSNTALQSSADLVQKI
jgi:hypothetical protein